MPTTVESQPRVLKADSVRGLAASVAFNFDDLRERCDGYVAQVREQTRQMLLDAHAEAESIRQAAHATGLAAGRTAGLRQAEQVVAERTEAETAKRTQQAVATAVPALTAAATALSDERERWLAAWERLGVELAVAMAERVLRAELQLRPERVGPVVREVLQMTAGESDVRLHLHPDDAAFVVEHADEWLPAVSAVGRPEVVPDATVSRGGCVVRTAHGEIDARIETQLARIATELLPEVGT